MSPRATRLGTEGDYDVSALVADEAHCISEWGHDFRFLEVVRVEAETEDHRTLHELLLEESDEYPEPLATSLRSAMDGPGIVYTATTKKTEETAEWLREWDIAADHLNYLGEETDHDCGNCDSEVGRGHDRLRVAVAEAAESRKPPNGVGDRVTHQSFGAGVVQRVADDSLTVLFEAAGRKILATGLVLANGLLQAAE